MPGVKWGEGLVDAGVRGQGLTFHGRFSPDVVCTAFFSDFCQTTPSHPKSCYLLLHWAFCHTRGVAQGGRQLGSKFPIIGGAKGARFVLDENCHGETETVGPTEDVCIA